MGGFGSGNFQDRDDKKNLVEECLSVDISEISRMGLLKVGTERTLFWEDAITEKPITFVNCASFLTNYGRHIFALSYYRADSEVGIIIPIQFLNKIVTFPFMLN